MNRLLLVLALVAFLIATATGFGWFGLTAPWQGFVAAGLALWVGSDLT